MLPAPKSLADLRLELARKFSPASRPPARTFATGLAALDDATGGLPLGAVTELVCAAPSCGGQLFLGQLLAVTRATRTRLALVDATDAFDPDSFSADLLAHLVWVRCAPTTSADRKITATATALLAADLLARDANLGLVVLDLRRSPAAELRRIPGPQWYRFQRAVEPAELALVVFTPRPSVPSAQLRLVLTTSHDATAFTRERPALTAPLAPKVQRQRLTTAATA